MLAFDTAIEAFRPELPFAVGFSGGADSTALLLACARRWPGQVGAIHVHHGLQAAADDFARHCESFCEAHGIALEQSRVQAQNAPGQSPEDAARVARYAALAQAVAGSAATRGWRGVALAQHADDQAETLLLALTRGAGLPGLAAMAEGFVRNGVVFHRPLLAVRGADLRAWLTAQGVGHIDDPSNGNEHFTRNRIRARLLPALEEGFPAFRDTFARSARHAAQAQDVLDEVAREDLARAAKGDRLLIARVQALSTARQVNLLRHWLRACHGATPSSAQVNELQDQLARCSTRGHAIRIKVAEGFALREGECLAWYNAAPDASPRPT